MTFPEAIKDAMPPDDNMRIGTVLSANPVIVDIQGNPTPCGVLASYTPVIGDVVSVLRQDSTWLVVGRIAPSDGGSPGGSFQSQAGSVDVSVAAASSNVTHVTFARPFTATPSVVVNISTAPGPSAGWGSRAINVDNTGFDSFIFSVPAGTPQTFSTSVHWQAQEMTQ